MRRLFVIAGRLIFFLAGRAFGSGTRAYPARDITDIVTWNAGGGTDVSNRLITAAVQEGLGLTATVTNATGRVAGIIGIQRNYSISRHPARAHICRVSLCSASGFLPQ